MTTLVWKGNGLWILVLIKLSKLKRSMLNLKCIVKDRVGLNKSSLSNCMFGQLKRLFMYSNLAEIEPTNYCFYLNYILKNGNWLLYVTFMHAHALASKTIYSTETAEKLFGTWTYWVKFWWLSIEVVLWWTDRWFGSIYQLFISEVWYVVTNYE